MEAPDKPGLVLAYGLAAALVVAGFLWGLQFVIPVLASAFGIIAGFVTGGITASVAIAPWVAPIAGVGIGSVGVVVLIKQVKNASSHPYEWILPVLSILTGFIVDLSQELYPDNQIVKIAFASTTSAIFFAGGLLWKRSSFYHRLTATILYLLPPVLILANAIRRNGQQSILIGLQGVEYQTWISIGGLLAILVVVAFLARTLRDKP